MRDDRKSVDATAVRWVKVQSGASGPHTRSVLDGARVALCHEWTMQLAGSERVASAIAEVVRPDAVFTLGAKPEIAARVFPGCEVWVPRFGLNATVQRHWQELLLLFHAAWASLTLEGFDVVITSSHSCVNAVRTGGRPHVVSYCHTPMRYAWAWQEERSRVPAPLRPIWPAAAAALRAVDRRVSRKVDTFIANSAFIAGRITYAYGAESTVVHPPVDTSFYTPPTSPAAPSNDYVLFAGRTVGYKRPDIAVEAARLAGVPIVVAGSGPLIEELRPAAPEGVTFVERPSDAELRELYRGARALISPGVEDFGMTNVEAMACGTPVLAYDRGGARDSVDPGSFRGAGRRTNVGGVRSRVDGASDIVGRRHVPRGGGGLQRGLLPGWDRGRAREDRRAGFARRRSRLTVGSAPQKLYESASYQGSLTSPQYS